MGWISWAIGLALAWFSVHVFGWLGAVVVLVALCAWHLHRLEERLQLSENRYGTELEILREQIAALRRELKTEEPANTAAAVPLTPAAAPSHAPRAEPPQWSDTLPSEVPDSRTDLIDLEPSQLPAAVRHKPMLEVDEASVHITSSLGASLHAWFTGGNSIVRVAVLILFIGVAFLLNYVAEHTTVPIELRIIGVVLFGTVLVGLGRRLLAQRRAYALSLQGAGVGIIYLTLFSAYRFYGLMPAGLAFTLLGLMATITAVLAVSQNALPLAVLGFGGAFIAPVLTSTGHGSHVGLFSYCLLLNLAIAWIAQKQAWKMLNLLGFFFTSTVAGAWGAKAYGPEHFWSTEAFLVLHFLLYLFIAVQYTQNLLKAEHHSGPALPGVDGSLLFGVPIVAFGMQAMMLKGQSFALAASATVLSAIYLYVGRWLWQQAGQRMLLLVEGLLALGVIFLALVVPLALDARWTAAAWAIQGVGVLWVGLRQRRWWAAGMGMVLQVGAALTFWSMVSLHTSGVTRQWLPASVQSPTPFLSPDFLGALILAGAALATARLLQRLAALPPQEPATELTSWLQPLHFGWIAAGVVQLWWFGWLELHAWPQSRWDMPTLGALWSAVLVVAFELAQRRMRWPELRWSAMALMLVALWSSTAGLLRPEDSVHDHWKRLTEGWGLLEALGLTALGLWLHRRQASSASGQTWAPLDVLLTWYAMLQGGRLLYTAGAHLVTRHEGWTPTAAIVLPTLIALWLMGRAALQRWPVGAALMTYRSFILRPWQVLLAVWVLLVNAYTDAGMAPLPYLPVLNPVDLGHGLVLLYCLRLGRLGTLAHPANTETQPPPWSRAVGAALAFWWLNSLLIRTLHHWADTPMWMHGALGSSVVQTGLTVLWTLSALVIMLYATRRAPVDHARTVWAVGAALLAVVVLKLFVVDLSHIGTLQRIVSFLAVGGLMLVIGYVSPIPPTASKDQSS